MGSKTVEIPEIGSVVLQKRRNNRSLRLTIAANGQVRVSLPTWLPYKMGEQFARTRADWIIQNRLPPTRGLLTGHSVGKAHHIAFSRSETANRVTTRIRQNQIEVTHPATSQVDSAVVQGAALSASIRALRKEAEALLPQRLRQLAADKGFEYRSVAIRQLRGRWGSCSAQRDITLNLFLMQLPWPLIDYVLVHELVHTKVLRHGLPFWEEFERHLPNVKELRKEMRKHRPALG